MSDTSRTEDIASTDALLWNATKVAAALGISTRALWTYTNTGEIPSVKIGSRRLYPVAALREWIAERLEGGAR